MNFFFSFLASFTIASFVAPLVIRLYTKKNWLDNPTNHRHVKVVHKEAVPRGGGIVVFSAVLISSLLFLWPMPTYLISILIGAGILMLIGFFDDVFDISPYIRLIGGVVVALIVVISGVGIEFISHPFTNSVIWLTEPSWQLFSTPITFSILADSFAIVWIVWNMNIVNWSKGLDGQLPGVVSIATVFIGLLALRFVADPLQIPVIYLSFIVSGAFLGLLLWNMYPQKIMPGYGGGSLGGYFLAILSILSGAKLATAVLVLAIPTADAIFTISRRLLRKKSPFWGDRGHLHHKLLDVMGWSKRQVAAFYWLTTAMFGFLALQLKPGQKFFTIVTITCAVFGFLIWVKLFISFSRRRDRDNG